MGNITHVYFLWRRYFPWQVLMHCLLAQDDRLQCSCDFFGFRVAAELGFCLQLEFSVQSKGHGSVASRQKHIELGGCGGCGRGARDSDRTRMRAVLALGVRLQIKTVLSIAGGHDEVEEPSLESRE